MYRTITLLGCLLTILSSSAQSITLQQCREMARENYPAIRQYGLISLSEQYSLDNVDKSWLPQLTFGSQATWQTAVPALPDALTGILTSQGVSLPGMNKDQYKISLDVSQTIWDGGASKAERRLAKAEALEQSKSLDVEMYELDGRVDNIFFGIMLLDQQKSQLQLTIELLQSNLDKIRSLVTNGVAMASDADIVEAQLLTVSQQLTQVSSTRESYTRMLSILTGGDMTAYTLVCPSIDTPESMVNSRPELSLFEAQSQSLTAQESMINASVMPKFALFAQGYYGYPGMDYFENMFNGRWSWNAMVGIRLSWNIGAFYTKSNSLNKLRVARQSIDVQRDVFEFNTRLQTTDNLGEIERLRNTIVHDDRIVSLRKSVREAAESQLRNGVIDTSDLLAKITDEATASIQRASHEIELLKAIYTLHHTLDIK